MACYLLSTSPLQGMWGRDLKNSIKCCTYSEAPKSKCLVWQTEPIFVWISVIGFGLLGSFFFRMVHFFTKLDHFINKFLYKRSSLVNRTNQTLARSTNWTSEIRTILLGFRSSSEILTIQQTINFENAEIRTFEFWTLTVLCFTIILFYCNVWNPNYKFRLDF